MGLFKKKAPEETGEKKDLKANYTTEDHKTDINVLLSSLNTHPTNVGRFGGSDWVEREVVVGWHRCNATVVTLSLSAVCARQSGRLRGVVESDVAHTHTRASAEERGPGLCENEQLFPRVASRTSSIWASFAVANVPTRPCNAALGASTRCSAADLKLLWRALTCAP